jgi:lipid II:glycine glycyltransferase (peptidoglycan interpeptide bridge formation enzyme)
VDLFRATSNNGVKTYGSYLVQWKVVEYLKERGCLWYNLNGINPPANPGGYQFKSQMGGKNGRDVCFLGSFDSYPNSCKKFLLQMTEHLRTSLKRSRQGKPFAKQADASVL